MILLGLVLVILGLIFDTALVEYLGIAVLLLGIALAIAGAAGRGVGGRRHYY